MKWNFLYQITAASRLGGYRSQIPVLSVLCPQLNLLTPPPKKIPGYATVPHEFIYGSGACLLKFLQRHIIGGTGESSRNSFSELVVHLDAEPVHRIYKQTRSYVAAEPSTTTAPSAILISALKGTLSIRLPSQVLN